MHWVFLHLDARAFLTRRFGVRRWIVSDEEAAHIADQVRQRFLALLRQDAPCTEPT
jgi:hypothetical protein